MGKPFLSFTLKLARSPLLDKPEGKRLVFAYNFGVIRLQSSLGVEEGHPACIQLETLFPNTVAVGSGLIINSYGSISKQQDIVIHEQLSPKFSFNDTPEATFFPIEGVCAVGEVKTVLTKSQIYDAVYKSMSAKKLLRYAKASKGPIDLEPIFLFRHYGAIQAMSGTKSEEYNQSSNSLLQVYFFANGRSS